MFSVSLCCYELGEDGEDLRTSRAWWQWDARMHRRVLETAEWIHLLDKMATSLEADIRKIKPGQKRVAVGES